MRLSLVSCLVGMLSTSHLAKGCAVTVGWYNSFTGILAANVIDNGELTCSYDGPINQEPNYWDCIDGYHAFASNDLGYFAYDTPGNKDMRLALNAYWATRYAIAWKTQAWGC
jgi:hypothetical protein